jgi:hypothetical protein
MPKLPYPIIRKILSELDFLTYMRQYQEINEMLKYKTETRLEWQYLMTRAKASLIVEKGFEDNATQDVIYILGNIRVTSRTQWNNIGGLRMGKWDHYFLKTSRADWDNIKWKCPYSYENDYVEIYDEALAKKCVAFCLLIRGLGVDYELTDLLLN